MAGVHIDGRLHEVDENQNLLHVALSLGYDLPYFCWHPALGSVGACRQCAVKQFRNEEDEKAGKGKLVMACMTAASEGTRISIADQEARAFRAAVVEWLMVNHPHDCPVCDEGGECHLQDMTVMTGHDYREYRFLKRTHRNQYLGPFINHEMNRCIACYRCVRFYRDFAGGRDLEVLGAHDQVYFGRKEEGTLESEFAGNLVEVCPTGVFTDKSLKRHYTRKWDLTTAPSVCVHCSLGCNTLPGERYRSLRRIRARYHGEVNGYFLCDRGRYGYEFVNDDARVRVPLLPRGPEEPARETGREEALRRVRPWLERGERVIGIGSPRATLESNFALRTLVGPERFFQGVDAETAAVEARALELLRTAPLRTPALRELEKADAILVVGEDVSDTAPLVALALRQAIRRKAVIRAGRLGLPAWQDMAIRELMQRNTGPLYLLAAAPTRLDGAATRAHRALPEEIARLALAVAHELDPSAPTVAGLAGEDRSLAAEIARELREAERPVIVSGTGLRSVEVVEAAAAVAVALGAARKETGTLLYAFDECNSLGTAILGGKPLDRAFEAVADGAADTVIVLENDLYRRADPGRVDRFLAGASHVVVLDHSAHATGARAEVLLPAAAFPEGDGTLVNNEGRAQRSYQVFVPEGDVRESWRWLRDLMAAAHRSEASEWTHLDPVTAALAAAVPAFGAVPLAAPPASFRMAGARIPRQPARYSGRTSMLANVSVHEPAPPDDPDSPLSFTMEGFEGEPPPALLTHLWAPGWNSVQSVNKFQIEVDGPLRGGDPGVRLLEPAAGTGSFSYPEPPDPVRRDAGEFRVVRLHHVFGSEELSVRSPGVAERAPSPYLAINPADAEALGVADGDPLRAVVAGTERTLPARLVDGFPRGAVGVPVGLPGLPHPGAGTRLALARGGAS